MSIQGRIIAICALLVALVTACALPNDESAQPLTGDEVEGAMNPTSTSTTEAVGDTEERELFFFDDQDLLVSEVRTIPQDTSTAALLEMLAQGPETDGGRTSVPEDFVVSETRLDDGTLTIVLANDALFQVGGLDTANAVAQIVLTATQIEDQDITDVAFEFDGQPHEVPAGPDLAITDEPVGLRDYCQFLPNERCAPVS